MTCKALLIASALPLAAAALEWKALPPLPDSSGFAGSFAGVSGGALIVAGGTNFPDKMPWQGGTKTWYDHVFALDKPDGRWRKAGNLPKANGYGVSITASDALILVGGGDAREHFRDVIQLRWDGQLLKSSPLPPLPKPCAFMAGALLDNTLYVAGGIEHPDDTTAMKSFWSLNLGSPGNGWNELQPWPGPGRILAAAGSCEGSFFLFSGAALKPGPDGKPAREWLRDAYGFTPGEGWRRVADPPRVAVAAPSPLPQAPGRRLLVIGGDDGRLADFEPKDQHPGFPRSVLSYHAARDAWTHTADVPFSLVTTPAVIWNGCVVIPGGEARPGVRSAEAWSASLDNPDK